MQVILQEKIKNLGAIGQIVDVKPGYARNYLFRSGKALPASKENVNRVMAKRSELEKVEKQKFQEAKKRAEQITKIQKVDLTVPTNEEGRLFGSISAAEIVDALISSGVEVAKQEISILESPIRAVGTYTIVVETHPDVSENLILNLTSSTIEDLKINGKDFQEEPSDKSQSQDVTEDFEDTENDEVSIDKVEDDSGK